MVSFLTDVRQLGASAASALESTGGGRHAFYFDYRLQNLRRPRNAVASPRPVKAMEAGSGVATKA